MKKTFAITAALLISCSAVSMNILSAGAKTDTSIGSDQRVGWWGDPEETNVYVTISDDKKDLVLVQEPVTVTDIDSDGKLTINDALYIAHENNYEGGADAGYKSSEGQWGLGLDKLWGVENGGSYGYYVNTVMAGSLVDEIKNGDYIDAFVFPDPADLDYHYSWFDQRDGGDAEADSEVTLTLSYLTFDENWAPVSRTLEGAKITVNGNETDFVTDADGKVTIKLTEGGENVISAASSSVKIAPPSYIVKVAGDSAAATTTAAAADTTTAAAADTTISTTSSVNSSTASTTKATSTTAKKTTTSSKTNSPDTGVPGAGLAVFGLAGAAAAAFALRRRNEE